METASTETGSPLLRLSNSLADAVEAVGRSTVSVNARGRLSSSGVVWRAGVIVTADHTVERDEGITVTLPDGTDVPAKLAGRDAGTDLAVLKIEGADIPVAEIAEAASVRVGHIVVAVARPGEAGLSASWGAISTIGGPYRTWSGGNVDQLVRPDLTLYPGFSGGPLVDAQGQVVGINTSGLSRSMTLAVPVATVNRVIEQLLTKGRIARGYLGLGMQPVRLPDKVKSDHNLPSNGGLIVVSVEAGGPAEKAGILMGDVIVTLDGKSVADTHDVQSVLDPDRVGTNIPVRVLRGGLPTDVTLTVGERPVRGE